MKHLQTMVSVLAGAILAGAGSVVGAAASSHSVPFTAPEPRRSGLLFVMSEPEAVAAPGFDILREVRRATEHPPEALAPLAALVFPPRPPQGEETSPLQRSTGGAGPGATTSPRQQQGGVPAGGVSPPAATQNTSQGSSEPPAPAPSNRSSPAPSPTPNPSVPAPASSPAAVPPSPLSQPAASSAPGTGGGPVLPGFGGGLPAASQGTLRVRLNNGQTTVIATLSGSNMAPGDTITGSLEVANAGSLPLEYAVVGEDRSGSNLAEALTAAIDSRTSGSSCTAAQGGAGQVAVTPAGASLRGALVGSAAPGLQPGDRRLAPGGSERLCFYVTLPLSAGNASQGSAATFTVIFAAEQALGT